MAHGEPSPLSFLQDWASASVRPVRLVARRNSVRPESGPVAMMIDMDDPEHLKRRKLVNRGFTPRRVRALTSPRYCDPAAPVNHDFRHER